MKQPQQGLAAAKLLNQPSISITPLPRQNPVTQQGSSSSSPVMNSTGAGKSGKPVAPTPVTSAVGSNNKNSFVVCEICDGYIKVSDLTYSSRMYYHGSKEKSYALA